MPAFLTKKQLRERWCDQDTGKPMANQMLDNWISEGLIKPIKPGKLYFSMAAIEAVEHLGLNPEEVKVIKFRNMERELNFLRKENDELRDALGKMISLALPHFNKQQTETKSKAKVETEAETEAET